MWTASALDILAWIVLTFGRYSLFINRLNWLPNRLNQRLHSIIKMIIKGETSIGSGRMFKSAATTRFPGQRCRVSAQLCQWLLGAVKRTRRRRDQPPGALRLLGNVIHSRGRQSHRSRWTAAGYVTLGEYNLSTHEWIRYCSTNY